MRSPVPIVSWCSWIAAAQSPARGAAPPTTTTVFALGSRSPGRKPSGAMSNAAASATRQTTAPPRSACSTVAALARAKSTPSASWVSLAPPVGRAPPAGAHLRPADDPLASLAALGVPRAGVIARRLAHLSLFVFWPTGQTRMHSKHCATLSL